VRELKVKFPKDANFCLSLTFNVEMVSRFPYWMSIWDHKKGSIDEGTKKYVEKLCDIARECGIKLHFYVVGSAFEDEDILYLERVVKERHSIGNYTYHHINIKAKTFEQLQISYSRRLWLRGSFKSVGEVIRHEISMINLAIKERLGVKAKGFRAPGCFHNDLKDMPEVQEILMREGFKFVSTQYFVPIGHEKM